MAEQRVQKVLADQGICSRREAERLIAAGKVKVNGHPVTLGDKMDPDYDKVMIDGQTQRIVRKRQYTYIMLHKPRGYLTTRSDDRGRKTVMDLVSDVPAMLRPVGRLDKDSEGLLLMTDDGAFINMLTHPSGGVGKLYRVTVNPRATEQQIIELRYRRGIPAAEASRLLGIDRSTANRRLNRALLRLQQFARGCMLAVGNGDNLFTKCC